MKDLTEKEREAILKDVAGSVPDQAIVCSALNVIKRNSASQVTYGVRKEPSGDILLRVLDGVRVFGATEITALYAISSRVERVTMNFAKRRLEVRVSAANREPNRGAWRAAKGKRKRVTEIDYAASQVTDREDVRVIDGVVSDVYHSSSRMPDTRFWFEPIVSGLGAYLEKTSGAPVPLTGADDDASESSQGGSRAPESARVGYALCFINMPEVDAEFVRALQETYGPRIASAYAWFAPQDPLFVVNVTRLNAGGQGNAEKAVKGHLARPWREKRKKVQ